jgi:hypothetical protein
MPISVLSAGAVVGWAGIAVGSIGTCVGVAEPPQAATSTEKAKTKLGMETRWKDMCEPLFIGIFICATSVPRRT